uniref:Testis-expressed protein 13B n=1 Tax=Phocoena sinus TaxID=42100 RepID=A0A8C9CT03_PHOSS
MALKLEDPGNGFRHGKVVAFINESMARHEKGSAFYLENISLSWAAVEDKLRAILEDHQVSSEAKEACVWGSLALGVRFAHRQSHLHRYRVEWLYYFAKLHKSVARALVSDMKLLKAQQDVERKEAASLLQLAHARLAEVQKERDLLRWRLLQAESAAKVPGLATDSGTGTEGAGEEEEEAGATAPTAAASGATGGGGRQKDVEGSEAAEGAEELCGDLMQLLRGGRSQVHGHSHALFTWDSKVQAHSLTGLSHRTVSCPAPCLIPILTLMPLIPLPRRTHVLPTSSAVHSRSSISDVSLLGAL